MNKSWLVLPVALFAASCGADGTITSTQVDPTESSAPPSSTPDTPPDNEGGFGAPSQTAGEFDTGNGNQPVDYTAYDVTGSLHLETNGCWFIRLNGTERLIAFPERFTFGVNDSSSIVDDNRTSLHDGDQVDGITSFRHESALPGGESGKWGNYFAFCNPTIRELAVFDEIGLAFDPSALSESEIVELVATANFDQQWPCGRGWATSTADQRVGILIFQADDKQPVPSVSLKLPNPSWTAEVVVGKHLFVNNCNDAIEEWVPEGRITVGQFPISGEITIHDVVPNNDDVAGVVSATLSDASINIGAEEFGLPTIELLNTAYNFFAG